MNYTEAFNSLGYTLDAPRTDWSAAGEKGVCVTLWLKELKFVDGRPRIDTRKDAGPHEIWSIKPGAKKRLNHLALSLDHFSGRIDVIIVHGRPGESYDDADPWRPERKAGASWFVDWLDRETGHFVAEVRLP